MIIYKLICENDHQFEGWFTSNEEFEKQHTQDKLSCPVCGDEGVTVLHSDSLIDSDMHQESDLENASQNNRLSSHQVFQHLIGYVTQDAEDFGNAIIKKIRDFHSQQTRARSKVGNATLKGVKDSTEESIEIFVNSSKMREKLH
ncbi:DUF1178 family protein [Sulfurirhabdus autotrophica]|uniref:DUF1178 family protein n=1 Tax=Sulfurirhabdus autotrophica TaxID=1706046 RepID=A0A4R3YDV5_9PROT|nr:DUF1178 family protein [Sulfurirhabdus autotrophica]TCV90236.1 hypothetical protein EDC63_101206 [Sulfurirhabdus autotrophica]